MPAPKRDTAADDRAETDTAEATGLPPQQDPDASPEAEPSPPGPRARAVVVLALLAGLVALAIHTRGYSPEAREFPLLTIAVMAGLLVLQGVLLLRQIRRDGPSSPGPPWWDREVKFVGWIVLLGVSVALLGLMIGVIVYLTLYLLAVRAARPVTIAVIVVLTAVGLYGLFVMFLQVRLPGGMLL